MTDEIPFWIKLGASYGIFEIICLIIRFIAFILSLKGD